MLLPLLLAAGPDDSDAPTGDAHEGDAPTGDAHEGDAAYRAQLMPHLEGLFRYAQTLTPDAESAAALVEATYRRAYALPPTDAAAPHDRLWLFNLLMQVRAEGLPRLASSPEPLPGGPRGLLDLRRRLALQFVDQALPGALATLPGDARQLLVLTAVEGFSCGEAGHILGLPEEAACRERERAEAALVKALQAQASPVEQQLLEAGLPDAWLADALRRASAITFAPLPDTLRPAVAEAAPAEALRLPPAGPPPPPRPLPAGRRLALALVLIVATATLAYALTRLRHTEPPEANVIALAAREAAAVQPALRTDQPDQGENFLLTRLRWRLTIPGIDGAELLGVGVEPLAEGLDVPVLLYADGPDAVPVTIFVVSYALLDQAGERLRLEPDVLMQIDEENSFDLHDLGEQRALVWRYRDDIFVAITPGDAAALQDRIYYPS